MSRRPDGWDLDELSCRALGGDRTAAVELEDVTDVVLRPEALVRAAEAWERLGDADRTEAVLRLAVAEGGAAIIDPRAALGSFLLGTGSREEAVALFEQARVALPLDDVVYQLAGEAWEAVGELEEALRWFDMGHDLLGPSGRGDFLRTGRWRLRRALGLACDNHDLQDERARALHLQPAGDATGTVRMAMVVPAADWAGWQTYWSGRTQASHDAHRTAMERCLAGLPLPREVVIVTLDLAGYLAHAEARGLDPLEARSREDYAHRLLDVGPGLVWPPGRNDTCWCGSARKYKKCCQPLGRDDITDPPLPT